MLHYVIISSLLFWMPFHFLEVLQILNFSLQCANTHFSCQPTELNTQCKSNMCRHVSASNVSTWKCSRKWPLNAPLVFVPKPKRKFPFSQPTRATFSTPKAKKTQWFEKSLRGALTSKFSYQSEFLHIILQTSTSWLYFKLLVWVLCVKHSVPTLFWYNKGGITSCALRILLY